MRFSFPPLDDRLCNCLTTRQYECVSLYVDAEYTQQQIADALGIAQCTVAYHLRQARDRIQGQAHGLADPLSLDGIDESNIVACI